MPDEVGQKSLTKTLAEKVHSISFLMLLPMKMILCILEVLCC